MQKLGESYNRLVRQLENDYMSKKLETEAWEKNKASKLQWHGRIPRKEKDEIEMIDELCEVAEKVFVDENDEKLLKFLTTAEIPGLKLSNHRDWYEPLLLKIIRERRKIPKEERIKMFRNDSVDEVDTTDLENWSFRTRHMSMKPTDIPMDDSDSDFDEKEAN